MMIENNYMEAKRICTDELREFYCDINDFLPNPDGSYFVAWSMEDALYVQRRINAAIATILSTCMRCHVAFEMDNIQKDMAEAIKAKNIPEVKRVLNNAVREFSYVLAACKAIKSE